jgi:hypothetical protein
MQLIRDGKILDTEQSKLIGSVNQGITYADCEYGDGRALYSITLNFYRTKKGNYFWVQFWPNMVGGALSWFGKRKTPVVVGIGEYRPPSFGTLTTAECADMMAQSGLKFPGKLEVY